MDSRLKQKNIFESTFDSFEFDDKFLSKVDGELNTKRISEKKDPGVQQEPKSSLIRKTDNTADKNKTSEVGKTKPFDLGINWDDFDDSDFFDLTAKKCTKVSLKVPTKEEKEAKELTKKSFTNCLSPIQGPISSKQKSQSFSSTPLKVNDVKLDQKSQGKETDKKDSQKDINQYVYLEADLFDDWDDDVKTEDVKKEESSSITLSQAFKMIEEAESEQKEVLNESIDLLTGEVVGAEVGKLFEESFDFLKSVEKEKEKTEADDDCVIICEKSRSRSKSQKKLEFGSKKIEMEQEEDKLCFSSDDDLYFLTTALMSKPKVLDKSPLKERNLREISDDSIKLGKKRGKCFKIIESDTADDSPSPKFRRQIKRKKRQRDPERMPGNDFVDVEAEVSDEVPVSSDEEDEDGEYEKSFLDEESYLTQNNAADMTARYLKSVKSVNRGGNFKIPAAKPYNPVNIFSQIPEESNTDYEIDSFCVNDVEEEMKTDLSDLEIAEKILEMDRKKRKKKSRKF